MLRSSRRRKEQQTGKNSKTNLKWEDDSTVQGSTLPDEERDRLHHFTRETFTYTSAKMDPPSFVRSEGSFVSMAASSVNGDGSIVSSVKEARSTMQSHAFWSQLEVESEEEEEENGKEEVIQTKAKEQQKEITSHVKSGAFAALYYFEKRCFMTVCVLLSYLDFTFLSLHSGYFATMERS